MNEIKILKDLIKINTIKDKENTKILDYIEEMLLKQGFNTEYKNKVLIMSIGKEYKLGFLGHTDTVNYIDGWKTNPFELSEIEGKLYGLGASDMKGGIAAILGAIQEIDFTKTQNGMKVYFTYDEEIGFSGIKDIVNKNEKFPENMIIGEPTNNVYLAGSKGLLEYKINFKGKKAHSSAPNRGESAIIKCIDFCNELINFYEINVKTIKALNFEIPYTTMNIGKIIGGDSISSVPEECEVLIDFRTTSNEITKEIQENIDELKEKYKFEYEIINNIKPLINKEKIELGTTNFITEASFIDSNSIILGPGPVTAHEVNEYIEKDSLLKTSKEYKKIIEKYCF